MSANALEFTLDEQPDCIELRGRTPTGRRSAPLKICGEALQARAYVSSYPPAITCHAGKFVDALPGSGVIDAGSSGDAAAASDAAEAAYDGNGSAGDAGVQAGATAPPAFGARASQDGCSLQTNPQAPPFALLALAASIGLVRRRRRS